MNGDTKVTVRSRSDFGTLPDGTRVERFQLDDGVVSVSVLDYGCIIQELLAPDRDGRREDVVLGFDSLEGYLGTQPYHGAVIGRFANRIAGARFELNGTTYPLPANDGPNHLHGGPGAFNSRVWEAQELEDPLGVRFRLVSPDGDGGYPARLEVVVEYRLDGGVLTITYTATNTEPEGGPSTVVNLTNHAYFNLAGQGAGQVGDHVIEVPARHFVAGGPGLIPTGELVAVDGTPFDLRVPKPFSAGWDADDAQIANAGGYDHTWVLDGAGPGSPVSAARVTDPSSGRVMEVATDQPGSHIYSGNMMEPRYAGKGGRVYDRREAFCVETQHFPDSPHRPEFPTTVVAPQETFTTTTSFRLTVL